MYVIFLSSSFKPVRDRSGYPGFSGTRWTSDCTHLPPLRSRYVLFYQLKSLKLKWWIYWDYTIRKKYLFNIICIIMHKSIFRGVTPWKCIFIEMWVKIKQLTAFLLTIYFIIYAYDLKTIKEKKKKMTIFLLTYLSVINDSLIFPSTKLPKIGKLFL